MPTISPGRASSASSRSRAKKVIGFWIDRALPIRALVSYMPRLRLPEQIRMKAMRSR
jgi:hypothetical protein